MTSQFVTTTGLVFISIFENTAHNIERKQSYPIHLWNYVMPLIKHNNNIVAVQYIFVCR